MNIIYFEELWKSDVIIIKLLLFLLVVWCGTTFAADSGSNAQKDTFILREGNVVINSVRGRAPFRDIQLIKIADDTGKLNFDELMEKEFSKQRPHIVSIRIPDTPFWLWIVDGRISSFFRDTTTGELWKIKGLEMPLKNITNMEPISYKMILYGIEGHHFVKWSLDFSDYQQGLVITYTRQDPP